MSQIELEFRVRWYQQEFHRALVERSHDRLMAIWHRRAGKDEIVLNAISELSEREIGTYWHCFPEFKQARKAIWNGINPRTGQRRIFDSFHPATIKRMQDDDMFLELTSGSTFQLIGSDRYDATVGSGPRGIAYSEWALSNPSAWAYHSPMIRESGGWAAFITTPRGNNHAKTMFERATNNPNWFAQKLSIEETGALSDADLTEALREYQDLHGIDLGRAFFEQEYLCSFSGAMVGAYFGAEVARAEREGRFMPVPIDRSQPVHTVWDLGKIINNPIICFQVIGDRPLIVDFYVPDTDDLEDWCDWLDDKGYHGVDYVPHDVTTGDWGSSKTRIERLIANKRNPERIVKVSVADGLQAGRTAINEAIFHQADDERGERVAHMVEGVKSYRREWDDERKTFRDNAYKDWAEHIGSAWRYLGLSWKLPKEPRPENSKPQPKPGQVFIPGLPEPTTGQKRTRL